MCPFLTQLPLGTGHDQCWSYRKSASRMRAETRFRCLKPWRGQEEKDRISMADCEMLIKVFPENLNRIAEVSRCQTGKTVER